MEGRILITSMEILVALVATFTYSKYSHNNLRYFLWYVWGVVLVELFGIGWTYYTQSTNLWIYNSLVIVQFPLLVLWYRTFLASSRIRKVMIWLIVAFFCFVVINSWFIQTFWKGFQSYNFIMGAICLIIAIFLYFNEVLHTEKILIIQRGLLFWVSVGFLFFYAGVIPIMIMGNVLEYNEWVYNLFLLILNIILHICLLIGLLWGKKKFN